MIGSCKVFAKVPIVDFRKAKQLKDILVRARISTIEKINGFREPCEK